MEFTKSLGLVNECEEMSKGNDKMNLEEDNFEIDTNESGSRLIIYNSMSNTEQAESLKQQIIQWQKKAEKYDELINQKLSS